MRDKKEPVQVKCPKCKRTQIIYIPQEAVPDCPDCKIQMNIEELLDEGKSY
jgi:ribosomal protein S27E